MSSQAALLRIGIDVGGTNTDAVLMRGRDVLAATKQPTTADVTSGVRVAIAEILRLSGEAPSSVRAVMVGTTHFVNAFVQRRELSAPVTIRIGLPMGSGIPPYADWPDDLRKTVGQHVYMVGGGCYYDGKEYASLDMNELLRIAGDIERLDVRDVAISSVFAPVRPEYEQRAAELLLSAIPGLRITCSAEVGGLGLIERENATIINAALQPLAAKVVPAFQQALSELGLDARLFLTQNDGTLMDTAQAQRYPVLTCSAGPTNSMRGGAFLSGLDEAVVVDIGGTTTDVGVLARGFPRETSEPFELGGVRTSFTTPDVLSVALGGGTCITLAQGASAPRIGPESVGYRLLTEARVFGGTQLTATDVAVARGTVSLGTPAGVRDLAPADIAGVSRAMHGLVEGAIDRLKTSAAPVPVVLVGGGAILIDHDLAGASTVVRPEQGGVANAIGAAIAQVGGRVKRLFDYAQAGGREAAIEQAQAEATAAAIHAGAVPDSVRLVEVEEHPMPYMQTDAVDLRVRVVGDLAGVG
ncbi:MAG: hydantoinase/oxoprolinase family protein [Pseudomonadota bacterium]